MNVQKDETSFPFDVLFLLGSHTTTGDGVRPQVGALIAKQQVSFNTSGQQPPAWTAVRKQDWLYSNDQTFIEADVTVYKPVLDVVVVRSTPTPNTEVFGAATINRGSAEPPVTLHYGWRQRGHAPRLGRAGNTDPGPNPGDPPVLQFKPEEKKPYKLPTGFDDRFFSGRVDAVGTAPLLEGHTIRFEQTVPPDTDDLDLTLTVPRGPSLNFTRDCWAIAPPVWERRGVDTVVLLASQSIVMLTWRFVFRWEERFALATLEVS